MKMRSRPKHAERGASLVIVLLVVSVVATVMAVILSQLDTSIRSSIALRAQAAGNYGGDAGAQAILSDLQHSTLDCSNPSSPTGKQLGSAGTPFYAPVSSQDGPLNAYGQCTPDVITGATTSVSTPPPVTSTTTVTPAPVTSTATALGQGDPTLPVYAILATGSAANDYGIDLTNSANGSKITVCIQNGSVGSNANINATGQTLAVRLDPAASGQGTSDCTTGSGTSKDGNSHLVVAAHGQCLGGTTPYKITPCTAPNPLVDSPSEPSPAASAIASTVNPTASCDSSKKYAKLIPGVYTSATNLNDPCNNAAKGLTVEWLSPGTYYFAFNGPWTWNAATTVGGTPLDKQGNVITTVAGLSNLASPPGSCADPATAQAAGTSEAGVDVVFGATSYMSVGANQGVLCASYSSATPALPVAIQALVSDRTVTVGTTSVPIPHQSSCDTTCSISSLISTVVNGQAQLYVKGYVYSPSIPIDMTEKNTVAQIFNWGIVARDFRLTVNGSSPGIPFVSLPKPNTGVGSVVTTSTPPPVTSVTTSQPPPTQVTTYTIRYVNVWTCTAAQMTGSPATCPHTGTPNVQVRVQWDLSLHQPVKVLSWTHIR